MGYLLHGGAKDEYIDYITWYRTHNFAKKMTENRGGYLFHNTPVPKGGRGASSQFLHEKFLRFFGAKVKKVKC